MIPVHYFPFPSPEYKLQMGLSPGVLIERDSEWEAETGLKWSLIASDQRYYCQSSPSSPAAEREAAALLGYPHLDLPALGCQVQEDLLILRAALPQELVAGHLCFANAWCLDEKMNQPLLAVHAPVPGYAQTVGQPTANLLARLKPGRPVWRLNWSLKPTNQLDLTSRWNGWVNTLKPITSPEDCFLRVERQGLAALPESQCVLFTIHTYQQSLGSLSPSQLAMLLGVLTSAPPEMLAYKGITPLLPRVLRWLRESAGTEDQTSGR